MNLIKWKERFIEVNKTNSNIILISRFRNYIKVVNQYGKFEEALRLLCGNSLKEIFNYCVKNTPKLVKLNDSDLEKDLDRFEYLSEFVNYKTIRNYIKRAFNLEKPLTGIEFYGVARKHINPFIECMEKYFFTEVFNFRKSTRKFSGEVFISRFKRFTEVGIACKKLEHEEYGEMIDWNGRIYGYSLQEIFEHCLEQNPDLVK